MCRIGEVKRRLSTGVASCVTDLLDKVQRTPGDPMHLGPERTAALIRQVLAERSYVVCHDTLTYGDFPDYRPAICKGFFDAYRTRSAALLILQAGRRLTEVPPPLVATAEELGRAAGKTAASGVFDGNTPDADRDLGVEPADRGLPRAASAYAGAFTDAFWQETERAAREHAG